MPMSRNCSIGQLADCARPTSNTYSKTTSASCMAVTQTIAGVFWRMKDPVTEIM